jgi:hypothetical protein
VSGGSFVLSNQDEGGTAAHDQVELAAARPVVASDEGVPSRGEVAKGEPFSSIPGALLAQGDPTPA